MANFAARRTVFLLPTFDGSGEVFVDPLGDFEGRLFGIIFVFNVGSGLNENLACVIRVGGSAKERISLRYAFNTMQSGFSGKKLMLYV